MLPGAALKCGQASRQPRNLLTPEIDKRWATDVTVAAHLRRLSPQLRRPFSRGRRDRIKTGLAANPHGKASALIAQHGVRLHLVPRVNQKT